MSTNSLASSGALGGFLRDRRGRLKPEPGAAGRRRTPGLRREEVALRAGVSVTWYTWLEQGRGGPPSNQVLERLARALELDAAGREALFLIAQQRPPPLNGAATAEVPQTLQRVLDAMPTTPAYVKTLAWEIVAWNAAAAALMGDFAGMAPGQRNMLRRLFSDPAVRSAAPDWEENARFAIAAFRLDLARSGDRPDTLALAKELQETSADFRRLWAEPVSVSRGAFALKRFRHPKVGDLTVQVSSFAVGGADGLTMLVFAPNGAADERAMAKLVAGGGNA